MNTVMKVMLGSIIMTSAIAAFAANEPECKSLQDEKNLIYAAHGYCFKDKAAQAEFGKECYTNKKPNFGTAENKRLNEIEGKMKVLNCPKKD